MALVWNGWGALRLLVGIVAVVLAVVVFRARPSAFRNRVLAGALVTEGLAFACAGLLLMATEMRDAYGVIAVYMALHPAALFLYLAFAGTLASPLAAPLRPRAVRLALVGLAIASVFVVVARMPSFAVRVYPVWFADWEVLFGPDYLALFYLWVASALYTSLVALDAWRRAPQGSTERASGAAIALAFAGRDVLLSMFLVLTIVRLRYSALGGDQALDRIHLIGWPGVTLLFLATFAYGLLKRQLFDVDLHVRWTLKQSTVAAVFVGVFFVVSESVATFFSGRTGTYVGIAAAGLLLVALVPLQRMAERLATRAMPGVEPTDQYVAFRKLEVYRAAVEGGLEDGEISVKERTMLERLRSQLAIAPGDAAAIERDVRERLGLRAHPAAVS